MGKVYSKAAKRAAKKAMPSIEPVPRREQDGRVRRSGKADYERSPEEKVLRARARQMGKPERQKRKMNIVALAFPAGQAIYSVHEGKSAEKLWDAYTGLTDAEAKHIRAKMGLSLQAKTAKIEMLPERFEARDDDHVDLRSDAEKLDAAVKRWMYWRGLVMHLPSFQQSIIFDVSYGRAMPMDGGKLTTYGGRFVEAVEAFARVVENKGGGG